MTVNEAATGSRVVTVNEAATGSRVVTVNEAATDQCVASGNHANAQVGTADSEAATDARKGALTARAPVTPRERIGRRAKAPTCRRVHRDT